MKPLCVLHFEKGIFITVEWALKNGTKNKTGRSRRKSHNASKRSGLIVDVCDAAAVRGRKAVFKSSGRPKNGGTLWACKDASNRRGPEAAEGAELACCHGAKQANRSGKDWKSWGYSTTERKKRSQNVSIKMKGVNVKTHLSVV